MLISKLKMILNLNWLLLYRERNVNFCFYESPHYDKRSFTFEISAVLLPNLAAATH